MIRQCRHSERVAAVITARILRLDESVMSRPDITLRLCGKCYLQIIGGDLGELFSASEPFIRQQDPEEQV